MSDLPVRIILVSSYLCLIILLVFLAVNYKKVSISRLTYRAQKAYLHGQIYLVHAKPEDYLVRINGGQYDRKHYYQSPNSYTSLFCTKVRKLGLHSYPFRLTLLQIAPYLTLFLNGTGWSPSFPRLMTNEQLSVTLELARGIPGFRFTNIGDISCDIEVRGGIFLHFNLGN